MYLAVFIQIVITPFLLAMVAFKRQPSRPRWLISYLANGMVIAFLFMSARWDISSLYLRMALPVAFVAAGFIGYRRITAADAGSKLQAAIFWAVNLGLMVLMSGFLWFSLWGYQVPAQAVDLHSPLKGKYVVLNGGNSKFTNAHFRVYPQEFALDIVGVNAVGNRAALFGSSQDLESYAIYGEPVFSPCDGSVSAIVNDLPDYIPPDRDTDNPAGNHVLIECGDFEVLLAHMQQGSVAVSVEDAVIVGARLGVVGNSGNTTEPHLHIHAERNGEPGIILDGEAVPITIAGRYLVRNSIFRGE